MPKKVKSLTTLELRARVKAAIEKGGLTDISVGGVAGLMLRVNAKKEPPSAAWVFRRKGENGGTRGLGAYPDTSLDAARRTAGQAVRDAEAAGVSLRDARRVEKEEIKKAEAERKRRANMLTASALFSLWLEEQDKSNPRYANSAKASDVSLFRHYIEPVKTKHGPRFGDIAADKICADDILAVTLAASKPLEGAPNNPRRRADGALSIGVQKRILRILRGLGDCAILHDLRRDNPAVGAEFMGLARTIKKPKATGAKFGALKPEEMPAFIRDVCELIAAKDEAGEDSTAARAFLFAVFTTSRQANARQLRRDSVTGTEWLIGAREMKVSEGGNHRVYLAPQAVELIDAAPVLAETDVVFASPRTGDAFSPLAVRRVIAAVNARRKAAGRPEWTDTEQSAALGRTVDITPHGLARATFRSWSETARDEDGSRFSPTAAELNLHHVKGNAVTQAYARNDLAEERRRLYCQWAKFCLSATPAALWAKIVRKPEAADTDAAAHPAPKAPEAVGDARPFTPPEELTEEEKAQAEERYYFGAYGGGR